jgi:hypothetical protein
MRSFLRAAGLFAVLALGIAPPASALETRLTELRVAGGSIRASLEIRDLFPAKFRAVLEEGPAIYLRLQIELWEDRPVWDKLVQPAVVTVLRIALDPATRQLMVTDRYGELSRQPAWQEPLTLRPDIGRADALSDGARYYVRVLSTLGTIVEKETERASKAVFGDDDGSVSLAAMGKILFHAVLQVSDYLQSVSSETRTRDLSGRDLRAGIKIQ